MKKILSVFFLICFSHALYAQTMDMIDMNNLMVEYKSIKSLEDSNLDNIGGSPYLTADYISSVVYFKNNQKPVSADLRFNAYSNEFEFTMNGQRFVISNAMDIDSIRYMDHTFIYGEYINEYGRKENAFMAKLAEGKCRMYKIHLIEFYEEKPPQSGYDEFEPAHFDQGDPVYCLQCDQDQPPKAIESFRRRKFLENFESGREEHMDFIREHRLRLYKEEDLLKFMNYYNANARKNHHK